MSKGRKIALGVLIFFVIVLLLLVVVVPLLIDIDRYRPEVAAHIQEETGKPAEIGRLSLSVFPRLALRVDDFTLGNPSGFPKGQFVKARRISTVVDAWALWHRQVLIKSLELDDPVINLISDVRGKWNFENPPQRGGMKKTASQGPSSFTLGVISEVRVNGGQLTAANLLASGRPGPNFFEAHDLTIRLEDVDLNAFIASSTASLEAPVAPRFSRAFSLGASVTYAAPRQSRPAAQGTLKADALRFGNLQATSVKSKLRLFPKQVFFDDLNFDLYGGRAAGNLSFNFAGQNPRYATSTKISGVDVRKLLEAFPDAHGKMTGKMEGNMKLSGEVTHSPDPLAGMRGTGQVSIKNGQLPSLQLNQNLMLLARLNKLGPAEGDPSSFSSMSTDLNIADQRITSNKIVVIGNGVDMDGSGSLALAGAGSLDYQGVAKLTAGQSGMSNLLAGLTGATVSGGKMTFPFTLGGTFANPHFRLKPGAGQAGGLQNVLAPGPTSQSTTRSGQTQQQQNPQDLVQGLSGLFKKKQTTQPK